VDKSNSQGQSVDNATLTHNVTHTHTHREVVVADVEGDELCEAVDAAGEHGDVVVRQI